MFETASAPNEETMWLHREIFDAVHDAILVHDGTTGRIELANQRAEEMYGFHREALCGLPLAELSANVPPYTEGEAVEWIRKACEEGPQLFEWQARHALGQVFWTEVSLRCATIRNATKVLATVRDIHQRKLAEEELRRSEEKFRAVLGNASDPVYCLNLPSLTYEYMSPAIEQVLGFTMEECLAGGLAFFRSRMHQDDEVESLARMEQLLSGNGELQPVVEYRFEHKTRGFRWINDSRSMVCDREGRAVAIIGNLRDSTLRKEQEAALEQRAHAALISHLEGTSLALVESDRWNRVSLWSPQAEKLFGWGSPTVSGKHLTEWDFVHPDDLPRMEAAMRRLLDRSEIRNTCVLRNFTKEGRVLVCEWHNSVVLNDQGEIQSILHLASDITLEKKMESALRAMAEGVELRHGETFFQFLCLQLAETLEAKFATVAMLLPERDRMVRTLGFTANGKVQPNVTSSVIGTPCQNVLNSEVFYCDAELQVRFPNDTMLQELDIQCYLGMPLHASDGRVIGLIAVFHTQAMDRQERLHAMFQIFAVRAAAEMERHQAEMALRRSEERYALAASGSTGGVWDWDIHSGGVYYSARFRELLGYSPDEFPSLFFSWEQQMHPDDLAHVQQGLEQHLEKHEPFCVEHRVRVKSGEYRWFEARGQALWDDNGTPYRMAGSALDIHQRKLDEQKLLRLNRLHAMSSGINEAIVRIDEPLKLYDAAVRIAVDRGNMRMAWIGLHNEATCTLRPVAFAGNHQGYLEDIIINLSDNDPTGNGPAGRSFRQGVPVISNDLEKDDSFAFKDKARARGFRACASFPLKPTGKATGVMLIYSDECDCFQDEEVRVLAALAENISFALAAAERESERHRAIEALRENERMVSTLMGNLPGAVYRCRVDDPPEMEFISEGCRELTGHDAEDLTGNKTLAFGTLIHPEDQERVRQAIQDAVLTHDHFETTYRILVPGGGEKWIWDHGQAIPGEDGSARHIEGFMTDVTEKRRMEEQMLRAQRMESIGTLAGGIAHDLNNILTPILMSLSILRMKLTQPRDITLLDSLETSANRGAEMVKQILGFARGVESQRILLNPKDAVTEIERLLHETFPKSIRLHYHCDPGLWLVEADPTQLNQVLLNLCVNARDAMHDGGDLFVSVDNIIIDEQFASMNAGAKPGPHIAFEVRDTGTGIAPEVRERIFDPFFTTKEVGKGTGLGLATTLGIVRSHHGFIELSSQVGKGSCFRVFFPAIESDQPVNRVDHPGSRLGNGELVLVVDDESAILTATQHALEAYGYRVITACDGTDGIATYLKSVEKPVAVISDMMMPVMDGPAMIQVLHKILPALPIIGTSGLTHQMQAQVESLGVKHFLRKPYTTKALLAALADVLPTP